MKRKQRTDTDDTPIPMNETITTEENTQEGVHELQPKEKNDKSKEEIKPEKPSDDSSIAGTTLEMSILPKSKKMKDLHLKTTRF